MNLGGKYQRHNYWEIVQYFRKAFLGLLLLIIVVGGIVAGIFTATEASVIAVLYATVLALFYGHIRFKDFSSILLISAKTTVMVMFLICTSMAMSWLFSFLGIPALMSDFLLEQSSNSFMIFLLTNIILLVIGTFMDITPAVLIFTPIFSRSDRIGHASRALWHCIGAESMYRSLYAPCSTILFVDSGVANISVSKVIKPLLPFIAIMILVLMVILNIPEIIMVLPKLFGL